MPPASTESRCLPSWETAAGTLSSLGVVCCPGWPARAGTARVHRGLVTATRPLFVRSSRAPSRPRALSRLLQPMFPRARRRTSSNIPNDWRVVGTTAILTESRLPGMATAEASGGQGPRNTVPRRSPPGLLPAETSPRPRSLRAPRVARTVLLPVRSDVGDERNRQRGAHLRGARRERVVRRPASAKRRDVHQPEGPFVDRPSATRTGVRRPPGKPGCTVRQRLFHHRQLRARDARLDPDGSVSRRWKARERPPVGRPQHP
jgi:hypothetical protein